MEPGFGRLDQAVIVREALPGELAEVGEIRVTAYRAGGHMSPDSGYAPVLRALGSAGEGTVLVAVADAADAPLLGTVMLQYWPDGGQVVTGEDEAEIRALAVAPAGQGQGTGRALLHAAIGRAERAGVRNLVLLTQPDMRAAQHLYQQAGFRRLQERDWSPRPGVTLLAYGLPLPPTARP
jgi:ribosomal protein S18 acetylase RimI-like enzyme